MNFCLFNVAYRCCTVGVDQNSPNQPFSILMQIKFYKCVECETEREFSQVDKMRMKEPLRSTGEKEQITGISNLSLSLRTSLSVERTWSCLMKSILMRAYDLNISFLSLNFSQVESCYVIPNNIIDRKWNNFVFARIATILCHRRHRHTHTGTLVNPSTHRERERGTDALIESTIRCAITNCLILNHADSTNDWINFRIVKNRVQCDRARALQTKTFGEIFHPLQFRFMVCRERESPFVHGYLYVCQKFSSNWNKCVRNSNDGF